MRKRMVQILFFLIIVLIILMVQVNRVVVKAIAVHKTEIGKKEEIPAIREENF